MKQLWFKILLGVLAIATLSGAALLSPDRAEAYQGISTPPGVYVTVTYTDPINVRSGPSTVYYPIIGQLNPGDVVPALGISPGREWIEISFAGGTGWVYASFISIAGGELQIVEPPPTPTPLITMTIDPTLAAAFNVQPTQTRLPTFTPPPPLEVPQFTDVAPGGSFGVFGIFILGLGLIGVAGLIVSFTLRK